MSFLLQFQPPLLSLHKLKQLPSGLNTLPPTPPYELCIAFPATLHGDPRSLCGGVSGNPLGVIGGVGEDRQEPRRLVAVQGSEEPLCSECYPF